MTTAPQSLHDITLRAARAILALPAPLPGQRRLVAIAGAPASGKSTLAEALPDMLESRGRRAALIPMDGFHLDNRILDARGLRARKGAPETFDAAGLAALLIRAKQGEPVIHPVFDRSRDIAIAGAGEVPEDVDLVLVEGNYLLLREPPWNALWPLWDLTIALHVPEDELRARLLERWRGHGLSPGEAAVKTEGNDLPNARFVAANSTKADLIFGAPPR